jgi:glucose-6-phosphate isomerase
MPSFKNLTATSTFPALSRARPFDVTALTQERVRSMQVPIAAGLTWSYAATPVTDEIATLLGELATEQELIEKFRMIAEGAVMNTGEQRMVLHHLLRGQLGADVVHDGRSQRKFYEEQEHRVAAFAEAVRSGARLSPSGSPYRTVVQIGIGGSDLGPRALYLALEQWAAATGIKPLIEARFVSNVDPDDASGVLADIDFSTTLFVLVSKSGTTQETLTNEQFVRELAAQHAPGLDILKQTVAVTSQTSPMATGGSYLDSFFIDDYIGGRYSATSPVGGVVLSVAFGPEVFRKVLAGAHAADRAAMEGDIRKNAALMDALIGVYYRNVLGYPATAVLPYSQG